MRLPYSQRLLFPSLTQHPQLSKASASCSPTKRRRTHTTASRTSRRRHCLRSDCVVNYNHQVFDQLPWISQIESEPPSTLDLWDIADLSLLPDPPSSGVGPVRNRRSSATLRSGVNPFGASLAGEAQPAGSITSQQQQPLRSRRSPLHLQLLPPVDRQVLDPRTPPPSMTFNPMEVAFQGLMPAFPPNDLPPFAAPAPLPM